MNRVAINPSLLPWARERADKSQKSLLKRFNKLPDWESGELKPTLKQLQDFATVVHVPLGYLFLPEPPKEKLPIADFRTISDTTRTTLSPNLLDTLYSMQRRQMWLREYLREYDIKPLSFVGSARTTDDSSAVGREMRRILRINEGWGAKIGTWRDAVSELRHRIEQLGVMAVINGVVGNDTNRKLSVEEFRGFALTDQYAPLIFVNGADAKSAQMFTLAHELAHIWLDEEGISGFDNLLLEGTKTEKWCNQAAAEFLAPAREFENRWYSLRRETNPFTQLARAFKVSPSVVARRALDLSLIERGTFFEFYDDQIQKERKSSTESTGGNFYNNQYQRVGQRFMTCVANAAMEGQIGFKEAYDLTGLGRSSFQEYAQQIGVRL